MTSQNIPPMRLSALICSRYRAFKERHRIELSPITIIIGKNGSGKSIISRLPLLLAGAISENADGPLDISAGGIDHANSFQDLVNLRGSLPFTLGAEISNSEKIFRFETTLRYIAETRAIAIEGFKLELNDSEIFSATISDAEQLASTTPIFKISCSGNINFSNVKFIGIFPTFTDPESSESRIVSPILQAFRQALPNPSYLGPFRVEPGPSMKSPAQNIRELGPKGERALEILADDRLRKNGELSRQVSDWFQSSMAQELDIDVSSDQPQVKVGIPGAFQGNLSDTGAGFSQCLPFVVQHYAYRADRIKAPILIVEQPELHLHPAAHGALADLVIDSVLWRDIPTIVCLVETHSEQFIMRIRRRLAEGKLPNIVSILSLNHQDNLEPESEIIQLKTIKFNDSGNPEAWPAGVFSEALVDLSAMRQAIREK